MTRTDPLPCVLAFLAGAIVPIPAWLMLTGNPVAALQASILMASAVCLAAASSPWWVDRLEDRRIDRLNAEADRDADAYFSSEDYSAKSSPSAPLSAPFIPTAPRSTIARIQAKPERAGLRQDPDL